MNDDWSRVAASSIEHHVMMASEAWKCAAYEYERPSVLFKPTLSADGDMWCALYGDDLQTGICGFGETPDKAMYAFDLAFRNEKTPASALAALSALAPIRAAEILAAERERDALREAAQMIADDYQSSPKHHPNDILIPVASFHRLLAALTANHSAPVVEE